MTEDFKEMAQYKSDYDERQKQLLYRMLNETGTHDTVEGYIKALNDVLEQFKDCDYGLPF